MKKNHHIGGERSKSSSDVENLSYHELDMTDDATGVVLRQKVERCYEMINRYQIVMNKANNEHEKREYSELISSIKTSIEVLNVVWKRRNDIRMV